MSELENPVDTVVRLLSKNMRLVKEDGSLASIFVSSEWWNRELFKNCDGQITVGLAENRDEKIEMSGRIRRRLGSLRVNIWTNDKLMRSKIVEEVNRIVRQNRSKPNEARYDFVSVGQTTGTHKAYDSSSATELTPQHTSWTELTNTEYEKIWYSDDQRHIKSHNVNGENALTLFRFKVESREQTVKKIVLAFEGYGTAPNGNGVTIEVWNHVANAWQNPQSGTGGADETVAITLTSNLTDYIDDDGFIWLLAKTTNPSDGATPAILYCDYASCTVTVNGITYLNVVSFRDVDEIRVRPFIFRTEFTLKSWFFEDIGGTF
jgi:hypothetical protein